MQQMSRKPARVIFVALTRHLNWIIVILQTRFGAGYAGPAIAQSGLIKDNPKTLRKAAEYLERQCAQ